jgi:ABC-2 type transport system permease protein
MMNIRKLPALIRREILEHTNLWRVPLILIGIAILVRLSLVFGNLSIDFDVPEQLQLDDQINSIVDGVFARALNSMNYLIMLSMFVVGIFYSLSCLYNERQDQSVLFWRSLPISDGLTVASKLLVALAVIPVVIIVCQAVVSLIFLDTQVVQYFSHYLSTGLGGLLQVLLWSMLPTVAWCLLCSEVASRNPFLLAFIAPVMVVLVDKLFLSGVVSKTLAINRVFGFDDYTTGPLIWGLGFAVVCIALAIVKRSQRI